MDGATGLTLRRLAAEGVGWVPVAGNLLALEAFIVTLAINWCALHVCSCRPATVNVAPERIRMARAPCPWPAAPVASNLLALEAFIVALAIKWPARCLTAAASLQQVV